MEVFKNRMEPNYDQIVDMGPKWWTEYREMNANYIFAGWTLDLMAYFLEKLIQNEFPAHCDAKTLSLLERLLKIEHDAGMSEEERRNIVFAYWSGSGKLTKDTIISIVSEYTGSDATAIWEGSTFVVNVDSPDMPDTAIAQIRKILDRRMPAHIQYEIAIANRSDAELFTAASLCGIEIVMQSTSI